MRENPGQYTKRTRHQYGQFLGSCPHQVSKKFVQKLLYISTSSSMPISQFLPEIFWTVPKTDKMCPESLFKKIYFLGALRTHIITCYVISM